MLFDQQIAQIQAELTPSRVRLIAVTKGVPVEQMRSAYRAGLRDFGESRIQEAEMKKAQLEDLRDVRWHLIGHLQSNKAQKALELFEWIHSVDSLKLLERLNRLSGELQVRPNICLQVKLEVDANKYGFSKSELLEILPIIKSCSHLNVCGLMVIPPLGLSEAQTLALFEEASSLAEKIRTLCPSLELPELSMGMSGDYHLAIKAGSTMVRLGTILFGDRPG